MIYHISSLHMFIVKPYESNFITLWNINERKNEQFDLYLIYAKNFLHFAEE